MNAIEPASARAHAFVDNLDRPKLDAGDRHHLERVLRLRHDDLITVSDGKGGWRVCRFGPELRVEGALERDLASSPALTIAFAVMKGARPELVVQKLTELGIDRIVPFFADRSVVRWDDAKAARQHARFVAVAREASMQSRRTWLPNISTVTTFASVACAQGAALAARGGIAPTLEHPVLLVGPEGGWSDQELCSGLPEIALGPQVLRAETAAIAAGAILSALRADLLTRNDHSP